MQCRVCAQIIKKLDSNQRNCDACGLFYHGDCGLKTQDGHKCRICIEEAPRAHCSQCVQQRGNGVICYSCGLRFNRTCARLSSQLYFKLGRCTTRPLNYDQIWTCPGCTPADVAKDSSLEQQNSKFPRFGEASPLKQKVSKSLPQIDQEQSNEKADSEENEFVKFKESPAGKDFARFAVAYLNARPFDFKSVASKRAAYRALAGALREDYQLARSRSQRFSREHNRALKLLLSSYPLSGPPPTAEQVLASAPEWLRRLEQLFNRLPDLIKMTWLANDPTDLLRTLANCGRNDEQRKSIFKKVMKEHCITEKELKEIWETYVSVCMLKLQGLLTVGEQLSPLDERTLDYVSLEPHEWAISGQELLRTGQRQPWLVNYSDSNYNFTSQPLLVLLRLVVQFRLEEPWPPSELRKRWSSALKSYRKTFTSQPLLVLLRLVVQFRLEAPWPPSELRKRWSSALKSYRKTGLVSSLIVLQRRWWELKADTREAIDSYWRTRKGYVNRAHWRTADKFPYVVTQPQPSWRSLVHSGQVVDLTEEEIELEEYIQPLPYTDPDTLEQFDMVPEQLSPAESRKQQALAQICREVEEIDQMDLQMRSQIEEYAKTLTHVENQTENLFSDTESRIEANDKAEGSIAALMSIDPTKVQTSIIFESDSDEEMTIDDSSLNVASVDQANVAMNEVTSHMDAISTDNNVISKEIDGTLSREVRTVTSIEENVINSNICNKSAEVNPTYMQVENRNNDSCKENTSIVRNVKIDAKIPNSAETVLTGSAETVIKTEPDKDTELISIKQESESINQYLGEKLQESNLALKRSSSDTQLDSALCREDLIKSNENKDQLKPNDSLGDNLLIANSRVKSEVESIESTQVTSSDSEPSDEDASWSESLEDNESSATDEEINKFGSPSPSRPAVTRRACNLARLCASVSVVVERLPRDVLQRYTRRSEYVNDDEERATAPSEDDWRRLLSDDVIKQISKLRMKKFCCEARRQRVVNDTRRRAAQRSGKWPRYFDINTHGAVHGTDACKCCCSRVLLASPAPPRAAHMLRARLHRRLARLLAPSRRCKKVPSQMSKAEQLADKYKSGGSSDSSDDETVEAFRSGLKRKLEDNEKEPSSTEPRLEPATNSTPSYMGPGVRRNRSKRKYKRKEQTPEKEEREKNDYNEWVRQKNLTKRFFSIGELKQKPKPVVKPPEPIPKVTIDLDVIDLDSDEQEAKAVDNNRPEMTDHTYAGDGIKRPNTMLENIALVLGKPPTADPPPLVKLAAKRSSWNTAISNYVVEQTAKSMAKDSMKYVSLPQHKPEQKVAAPEAAIPYVNAGNKHKQNIPTAEPEQDSTDDENSFEPAQNMPPLDFPALSTVTETTKVKVDPVAQAMAMDMNGTNLIHPGMNVNPGFAMQTQMLGQYTSPQVSNTSQPQLSNYYMICPTASQPGQVPSQAMVIVPITISINAPQVVDPNATPNIENPIFQPMTQNVPFIPNTPSKILPEAMTPNYTKPNYITIAPMDSNASKGTFKPQPSSKEAINQETKSPVGQTVIRLESNLIKNPNMLSTTKSDPAVQKPIIHHKVIRLKREQILNPKQTSVKISESLWNQPLAPSSSDAAIPRQMLNQPKLNMRLTSVPRDSSPDKDLKVLTLDHFSAEAPDAEMEQTDPSEPELALPTISNVVSLAPIDLTDPDDEDEGAARKTKAAKEKNSWMHPGASSVPASSLFPRLPRLRARDVVSRAGGAPFALLRVNVSEQLWRLPTGDLVLSDEVNYSRSTRYHVISHKDKSRCRVEWDTETSPVRTAPASTQATPAPSEPRIKVRSFAYLPDVGTKEAGPNSEEEEKGEGAAGGVEKPSSKPDLKLVTADNKTYRRISEDPLIYAQVLTCVSSASQANFQLSCGQRVYMYSPDADVLNPVTAVAPRTLVCRHGPSLSHFAASMNQVLLSMNAGSSKLWRVIEWTGKVDTEPMAMLTVKPNPKLTAGHSAENQPPVLKTFFKLQENAISNTKTS